MAGRIRGNARPRSICRSEQLASPSVEKSRTLVLDRPLDLRRTFAVTGLKGPTKRVQDGGLWRTSRTPEGPGTIRLSIGSSGDLDALAWGRGADWLLDRLPAMVGECDDDSSFTPYHDSVRSMARRAKGLRLPAVGTMVEVLIPIVLAQKVTGVAAGRSYRRLLARFGEPAPGPVDLPVSPDPDVIAGLPYYDFHPLGIEKKRADTLLRVCRAAHDLDRAVERGRAVAYRILEGLGGIGPWTSARAMMVVAGDPDAVPVGDYHIPNSVAWALVAEPRATDARMLELLHPYEGQRGRVIRLVEVFGGHAPAYGPKLAPRSFERH